MTFPTPNFKLTSDEATDTLCNLVEKKLSTLDKYLGDETDVICDVEFEKVAPNAKGPVYRLEVNLKVAGVLHRAEATMESFEQAIDEVRDELDKELRRKHKKSDTLLKKGGRQIKEMIRTDN